MSNTINPLPVAAVLDPRVDINSKKTYVVYKGASEVTFRFIPATGTAVGANTSWTFNAPPPSPYILTNRKVWIKCRIRLDFTSANAPPNTLVPNADALRDFPLQHVIETLSVTLNNTTASINMQDVYSTLIRFKSPAELRESEYSLTPAALDQFQNYDDGFVGNRNVLANYATGMEGAITPRGGFYLPITTSFPLTNGQAAAHLEYDVCEPIFLAPFVWGCQEKSAFIGLQTFTATFTLSSNLPRVWSHDAVNGKASFSLAASGVNFDNPQLLFVYLTPKELESIPRHVEYNYGVVDRYPTSIGIINSLTSSSVSSQNIQLSSIPNRMYLAIRRNNATQTVNTSDAFAAIQSITVNWNNRSGLFSSANQQQLYSMNVKNGYYGTFSQFTGGLVIDDLNALTFVGTSGAPLCIKFGEDIGLSDLECPGMLGTYQLQVNVVFANQNTTDNINYDFYIITVSEGVFSIQDNRSIAQVGVLSKNDVLNAKQSYHINLNEIKAVEGALGGDFLGDIGSFFSNVGSKLWQGVKQIAPHLPEIVSTVSKVAPMLGLGDDEGMGMEGYGARAGARAGVLVGSGGKRMSAAQLRKKLHAM